jgi:hypothetical protein
MGFVGKAKMMQIMMFGVPGGKPRLAVEWIE